MEFQVFDRNKEEVKRYLALAKIWKGGGFDDDESEDSKEFWRLAKLFPDIHRYVEYYVVNSPDKENLCDIT